MIASDDNKKTRLKMEKSLCKSSINVFQELSTNQKTENGQSGINVRKEIKQKYACHLFALLFVIHAHHIPEAWDWGKIGESIANYRSTVTLAKDAKGAYNKLANRIGAPIV